MTMMKAAVFYGRGDIRIEAVPVPAPGPGEVLLRVAAVGICGTDANEFSSGPSLFPIHGKHPFSGHEGPMIPGHELAGVVIAAGDGAGRRSTRSLVGSG